MDYAATDRDMSSWMLEATIGGKRFWLGQDLAPVESKHSARTWLWEDDAYEVSRSQRVLSIAGEWTPVRVAEVEARG